MTGRLQLLVRRWWRGEGGLPGAAFRAAAAPLEWLYVQAARRRMGAADAARTRVPGVRVVSVGNLAVGGTGKTPVAAWVARTLADQGHRVALVSRGYGRDEVLLHGQWNPDIPVVVDPDRRAAVRAAGARGADCAVLDDGFQHRRLARDVDLVLLAAEDPFPGPCLPRGPYREGEGALGRADGVVVTRRTAPPDAAAALAARIEADFPHVVVARVALLPGRWCDLHGTEAPPPGGPTLVAAGVARPDVFRAQVEALTGEDSELLAYADHHEFTARDVKTMRARAGSRTVVITEKDAVKLHPYSSMLDPVRVLTQNLLWEAGEAMVTRLVTARGERES